MNPTNSRSRTGGVLLSLASGTLLSVLGCAAPGTGEAESFDPTVFHRAACSTPRQGDSPWDIQALYDCDTRELFIPYQLWSGARWTGDKNQPCMHIANSRFNVDGDSPTTIIGPRIWMNPTSGKKERYWAREKTSGLKTQYFTCHERGIGRVYDSRRSRNYDAGRCKFPAGYGWKIGERRHCVSTAIEITGLTLDTKHRLETITFKWWTNYRLDHIYRYAPNQGMLKAWPQ